MCPSRKYGRRYGCNGSIGSGSGSESGRGGDGCVSNGSGAVAATSGTKCDAKCGKNIPCADTGAASGGRSAAVGKRGLESAASSGRSTAVGKRGRGGTIASEYRHGDGERACRGDKDARFGAANGNGDGPAHIEGNGLAEAKCDSAAHGRGAQADRAAQAEADCAQAEANRAQAEPETDGA